jgi:hypothetical protein
MYDDNGDGMPMDFFDFNSAEIEQLDKLVIEAHLKGANNE